MLRHDLLFEGTVLSRKHDSWETKTKIIFWSWGCKWAIKGKWTLVEFNLRVLFFCCYWHRKGCLLNKGAYLVGASFNRNIWRGPHIREGALIGRRALNRIITVCVFNITVNNQQEKDECYCENWDNLRLNDIFLCWNRSKPLEKLTLVKNRLEYHVFCFDFVVVVVSSFYNRLDK